ncbi:unnamed protein product [marine sediment metagenome]|uniref:Uncharacterized protein n=1 Tax=marine sediment metagenome TaxID=412755 RepID=X1P6S1_9ZZZZ
MTVKEALTRNKDGLPKEAFAIIGDVEDHNTWKLPHHRKSILRALRGKLDIEKTVDWDLMSAAVTALSLGAYRSRRVEASPEEILEAVKHLANHYRKAAKSLPDILAALA